MWHAFRGVGGIFINYRRDERGLGAQAVARAVRQHFGAEAVFSSTSIEPGTVYPELLARRLAECDVLVAVIHDTWLTALRDKVTSRTDWVRHEIATALAAGKPVIPVLIGSATMPPHHELPIDLVLLGDPQQARVRPDSLDDDLGRLMRRLERYVSPAAPPAPPRTDTPVRAVRFPVLVRRAAAWSAVALLGVMGAALLVRPALPPIPLGAVTVLSVFFGCYLLVAWLVVRVLRRPVLMLERRASTQSGVEYVLRSAVLTLLMVAVGYVGIHYAAAGLPVPWDDYVPLAVTGVVAWWAVGAGLRGYRIDRAARSDGVPGVVAGWRRDGKPDPFVWRRAAQGLHERLTGSPDWRRPRSRARQDQITKEYNALVDARSTLLRQAGRPWWRWLAEDHARAAVLGAVWAAATVGLVLAVVVELTQAGHPPLRMAGVAAGATILVYGVAFAGVRLGHGMMRHQTHYWPPNWPIVSRPSGH